MTLKYLFAPEDIKRNNVLYQYPEDLFREKGFCVIKNFIDIKNLEYF